MLLGPVPDTFEGPRSYAALKAAGVPMLGYGQFTTVLVNFLILAFIIFQLVKMAGRVLRKQAEEAPAPAPGPSEDIVLLREIRDSLRARP